MTMPTTESNARAIAASKGYRIEPRGRYLYVRAGGRDLHRADRWSDALKFLLSAPRLDGGQGGAA